MFHVVVTLYAKGYHGIPHLSEGLHDNDIVYYNIGHNIIMTHRMLWDGEASTLKQVR